jgi:hypothetical protein
MIYFFLFVREGWTSQNQLAFGELMGRSDHGLVGASQLRALSPSPARMGGDLFGKDLFPFPSKD